MNKSIEELTDELKVKIIETLSLEEVTPDDIDSNGPLFEEGLDLDSIDALELVVMLEKHYGILIGEMDVARQAFSSVRSLAEFVMENQGTCSQDAQS